ncbi:hypothetical protein [Pseudactinotalea terrae]|uniref:hypothetical protein n=1 Tax=Pseudactinotalea terrae TaxID=1743262 RepID=UPI0012E10AC8|nr:hypothetical protein [Pseudactinotalea terrae]
MLKPRRRGRLAAVPAALALAVPLLAASPASAADPPDIAQTTFGSIFVDTSTASFAVTTGAPATWLVIDDQGRPLAEGELEAGASPLTVPGLPIGQYTLIVTDEAGASDSTPFAVVTSFDGDRDVRFGLNTKFGLPAEAPGSVPTWNPVTETYDPMGTSRYGQELNAALELSGTGGVRDTIAWNQFEPEEARYEGGPEWYDTYIAATAEMDAPTLVILSYGNKLYDVDAQGVGAAPYTEEGIAAYAAYAREVLTRYEGQVDAVEIWNEYNGREAPWNRGPCKADARCYYEMLKVTYEVVKETHPEATIVGPAGVTIPYAWLDELFSYGALDYLDAVSVHPYGFPASPESGYGNPNFEGVGLEARIADLDALVREHNGGESKPLWFTEIGWGSYEAPRGVSEAVQADYLVRSHVLALSAGVDRMYWYSLRNDRTLPAGPGANWGLLRNEGDPLGSNAPKEAFTAYATMTRLLSGAAASGREEAPDGVRSYVFTRADGEQVRVLWSPDGPQDVTLSVADDVTATRIDGDSRALTPDGGRVYLTIGQEPIYVEGDVSDIGAGSRIEVSAPASATQGAEVTVTVTVDSTGESRPTVARLEIEGQRLNVTTPPRQVRTDGATVPVGPGVETTPLEGQAQVYTRTVLVDVQIKHEQSGWLAAEVLVDRL